MRNVVESTKDYEHWLRKQTNVSEKHLRIKWESMREDPFPFLRATFYRWLEQWPKCCPRLARRDEDVLLSVGDLHVDNFGTWMDSRGRLVWGVNDFDEACELPFTSDLVRLAASAALAVAAEHIATSPGKVCTLLLEGYRAGLDANGAPILPTKDAHGDLLEMAEDVQDDATDFWRKQQSEKNTAIIAEKELPDEVAAALRAALPRDARPVFRKVKKPKGLGGLGRRRFTAMVRTRRGWLAREAKALVPSALYWLNGPAAMLSQTASLLQRAIRDPDPVVQVHDRWLVRQLAPAAVKIELAGFDAPKRATFEPALFRNMGWETANVHLGSRSPAELRIALDRLQKDVGEDWLEGAMNAMVRATETDHERWKKADGR